MTQMTLPTNPTERKATPMWRGCVMFFAAALAGVARMSHAFNSSDKLQHDRKTTDHMDCAIRHAMDAEDLIAAYERDSTLPGTMEGGEHKRCILDEVDQAAWRMLAWSQAMHEKYGGAPVAPAGPRPIPQPPHVYENGRCWCGETHELPLTVGGTERGPHSVPMSAPKCVVEGCQSAAAKGPVYNPLNASRCSAHFLPPK